MTPIPALLQTPLSDWHREHGGRMVEFGGWSMPVQYSTIIEEHTAVRRRAGLFDISHMGRLTFHGPKSLEWLDSLTTNHVARLAPHQIQYSLIANEQGGVIDDILVYNQAFAHIVVCNASNRLNVLAQFERHRAGFEEATMQDRTLDTAMIAIQGPRSLQILEPLFNQPLAPLAYYHLSMGRLLGTCDAVISRTGYTGEDGFEIIVGASRALEVWDALLKAGAEHGITPCGLGARDTLRLEAAMPLYGHELTEAINPFAAGLHWAVKFDKGDFVGREPLAALQANPGQKRIGLRLASKRIARQDTVVLKGDDPAGVVTSGTFSPTLEQSIAMALVDPTAATVGQELTLEIRGHREPARVVKLPFYRRPKSEAAASA